MTTNERTGSNSSNKASTDNITCAHVEGFLVQQIVGKPAASHEANMTVVQCTISVCHAPGPLPDDFLSAFGDRVVADANNTARWVAQQTPHEIGLEIAIERRDDEAQVDEAYYQ